jgi:thiol-disulfide isomerase/thioredoxin
MTPVLSLFHRLPRALRYGLPLAALAAAVGLYVIVNGGGNSGGPVSADQRACAHAAPVAAAVSRAAVGEVAAFKASAAPAKLPDLAFHNPDGQPKRLSDMAGRTLLVNLWATWCAPCRKEMPALDALQGALGGPDFEVVAINIDTRNLDKPRQWLSEHGINRLAYYADPQAKVFQELKRVGLAVGMPTTLLVDGKGCGLGVLHGPAEWASADAKGLVRAALAR